MTGDLVTGDLGTGAAGPDGVEGLKVLVTGADGFIGSHLTEVLVARGASVRALCLYTSSGSTGWLDELPADVAASVEVRLGDIRDAELVAGLVEGVDVVLHLAALIAIPHSYVAPRSTVETNVLGTLNVLEAVRRHRPGRLVQTSTSEVYGSPRTVPITEDHPLQGQSPYSASKIGADALCTAYAASFDVPVTVLRPFNTYGPRQSARAVIPTVLQQMLAGATEIRLGSLDTRRDFTYVDDTCEGFVRAATAVLDPGTVVQLGTGRDVTVGEVVEVCRRITGSQARVVLDAERVRPVNSEVDRLLSDPAQAERLLGWSSSVSLETGLERTAEWLSRRPTSISAAAGYQR